MDLHTLQAVYHELNKDYKMCREMLENAIINQEPETKLDLWATSSAQARTSRQIVAKMIEKEVAERDEFMNREQNLREL